MKNIFKPVLILLVIALSAFLSITSFFLPKTVSVNAPEDQFSSVRAMKHVEKIAVKEHPIGSEENRKVRDYIVKDLKALELTPEIHKTYVENTLWGEIRSGDIENISAVLDGTDKEADTILMVAHYDSTPNGPGAADDASGVAVLLETARALKSSSPLKNDIIFLFTDGEEVGLLGAKAFVDQSLIVKDIDLVVNFEARGNTGPVIMFETADKNGWFMKEFKKSVASPVAYSFAYDIYQRMPNDTDFTMFKQAGKSGFNFAAIDGFETYHSPADNPANLNQRTLQQEGEFSLALAEHFGNLSLENRETSNAVYFTMAKSIFVLYSEWWTVPLSVSTFVLFFIAALIGFKRKLLSFKETFLGLLTSLLLIVLAGGLGFVLVKIFDVIYADKGRMLTTEEIDFIIKRSNIWMIGLILLTTITVWSIYRLVRRKMTYQNMFYGLLLLMILLAAVSSQLFKGASYLFVWPAFFTLTGLIFSLLNKKQNTKYLPLFILSAASSILIYLPVGYLLFESMTFLMGAVINVIISLPLSIIILSILLFSDKKIISEDIAKFNK